MPTASSSSAGNPGLLLVPPTAIASSPDSFGKSRFRLVVSAPNKEISAAVSAAPTSHGGNHQHHHHQQQQHHHGGSPLMMSSGSAAAACSSADPTGSDGLDEEAMSVLGGKASCRRKFVLNVHLLDEQDRQICRDMVVTATLTYSHDHSPVKMEDSQNMVEPPLFTTFNGVEFPAHLRPSQMVSGRASFKLALSVLSSKCDNQLFSVCFTASPKPGSKGEPIPAYDISPGYSRPIRSISRKRSRPASNNSHSMASPAAIPRSHSTPGSTAESSMVWQSSPPCSAPLHGGSPLRSSHSIGHMSPMRGSGRPPIDFSSSSSSTSSAAVAAAAAAAASAASAAAAAAASVHEDALRPAAAAAASDSLTLPAATWPSKTGSDLFAPFGQEPMRSLESNVKMSRTSHHHHKLLGEMLRLPSSPMISGSKDHGSSEITARDTPPQKRGPLHLQMAPPQNENKCEQTRNENQFDNSLSHQLAFGSLQALHEAAAVSGMRTSSLKSEQRHIAASEFCHGGSYVGKDTKPSMAASANVCAASEDSIQGSFSPSFPSPLGTPRAFSGLVSPFALSPASFGLDQMKLFHSPASQLQALGNLPNFMFSAVESPATKAALALCGESPQNNPPSGFNNPVNASFSATNTCAAAMVSQIGGGDDDAVQQGVLSVAANESGDFWGLHNFSLADLAGSSNFGVAAQADVMADGEMPFFATGTGDQSQGLSWQGLQQQQQQYVTAGMPDQLKKNQRNHPQQHQQHHQTVNMLQDQQDQEELPSIAEEQEQSSFEHESDKVAGPFTKSDSCASDLGSRDPERLDNAPLGTHQQPPENEQPPSQNAQACKWESKLTSSGPNNDVIDMTSHEGAVEPSVPVGKRAWAEARGLALRCGHAGGSAQTSGPRPVGQGEGGGNPRSPGMQPTVKRPLLKIPQQYSFGIFSPRTSPGSKGFSPWRKARSTCISPYNKTLSPLSRGAIRYACSPRSGK